MTTTYYLIEIGRHGYAVVESLTAAQLHNAACGVIERMCELRGGRAVAHDLGLTTITSYYGDDEDVDVDIDALTPSQCAAAIAYADDLAACYAVETASEVRDIAARRLLGGASILADLARCERDISALTADDTTDTTTPCYVKGGAL